MQLLARAGEQLTYRERGGVEGETARESDREREREGGGGVREGE